MGDYEFAWEEKFTTMSIRRFFLRTPFLNNAPLILHTFCTRNHAVISLLNGIRGAPRVISTGRQAILAKAWNACGRARGEPQ